LVEKQPVAVTVYLIVPEPGLTQQTFPPEETVTILPGAADHTPPPVKSENGAHAPIHKSAGPEIGNGAGLTVTAPVRIHPVVGAVYVTVSTPVAIPDTIPLTGVIEPVVTGVLAQVPPAGVDDTVVVEPTHTLSVPVIGVGVALTTAVAVEVQPEPNE